MRKSLGLVMAGVFMVSVAAGAAARDWDQWYSWRDKLAGAKEPATIDACMQGLEALTRNTSARDEVRQRACATFPGWLMNQPPAVQTPERLQKAKAFVEYYATDLTKLPSGEVEGNSFRGLCGICFRLQRAKVDGALEAGTKLCEAVLASKANQRTKLTAYVCRGNLLARGKQWKEAAEALDQYVQALEEIRKVPAYQNVNLLQSEECDAELWLTAYTMADRQQDAAKLALTALASTDIPSFNSKLVTMICSLNPSRDLLHQILADLAGRLDGSQSGFALLLGRMTDDLLAEGDAANAMSTAKLRYEACTLEQVNAAVQAISNCLRAEDMDVKRAAAFVSFQKFGSEGPDGKKGTADDLASPLADVERKLPKGMEEAIRKVLAEPPAFRTPQDGYRALRDRGSMYLVLGDYAKALKHYRCAYSMAAMSQMREASGLVPRALKAMDGHLMRANAYLLYQQYGAAGKDGKPGTGDDLRDPTPEISGKLDPEIETALQAAVKLRSTTHAAMLTRGRFLLALGDYKRAMGQFRVVFVKSGNSERLLLQAINGLAALIKAWDGNLYRANQYLLYQKHGSGGPEGKPGSLENPLKEVMKEIRSAK